MVRVPNHDQAASEPRRASDECATALDIGPKAGFGRPLYAQRAASSPTWSLHVPITAAPDGIDLSVPRSIEGLHIPIGMVHDLVMKQALNEGRTSTLRLSDKLCISPTVMTGIVEELRDLRFLEVQGVDGRDYLLAPSEAGRKHAHDRMQLCRYIGPAPVSLDHYQAMVRAQTAKPRTNLTELREAFSDLVISDDLLKEVGPAACAKGAMFLYGPPGTGKSSIAERLLRVYGDDVLVPFAVEVDSQIISVFDPVVHRPLEVQPDGIDPRWIKCKRPFIIVGGELKMSMLDLAYQKGAGIYLAPLQMQANNGILVIDDFGRQTLRPDELLNRWIVPLDRQRDYLTLEYGVKFEVPFDAKIVFSTNLEPESLGDEAFFRRIQSKILIPTITDTQFEEVLRRVASAKGVELTPDAPTFLRWMSRELGDGDLRPYLPGAVCTILESICAFDEVPLRLDRDMVTRIAHMYFTHAQDATEDDEPSSVMADLASSLAGGADGPPGSGGSSLFGGRKTPDEKKAAAAQSDWKSVAAKMSVLKDEPGGDDGLLDELDDSHSF